MTKPCMDCGVVKPLDQFHKHPMMKDGRLNRCKACHCAVSLANKAKRPEYWREYYRLRAGAPNLVEARKRYKKTAAGKAAQARSHAKWSAKHPERLAAADAVNKALRSGRITRSPCFLCGQRAEAHHPDYSSPLDVVWLCDAHHKQAHAMARASKQF